MTTDNCIPIEASTRVAALLDDYPELEDVLIGLAPPFVKLKNPFLRRSVAKVASLRHAAAVAGIPAGELVNTLREAVGQKPIEVDNVDGRASYFSERPDWFDAAQIVASIDESETRFERSMPIVELFDRANGMGPSEILELVTGHLPAPGIDLMKKRGFLAWSTEEQSGLVRTYFRKL